MPEHDNFWRNEKGLTDPRKNFIQIGTVAHHFKKPVVKFFFASVVHRLLEKDSDVIKFKEIAG